MTFEPELLDRLRREAEVEIETTSPKGTVHRTIIWIVADQRHAYIRSERGERGRWYRELRQHAEGALWLGAEHIPIRVEVVASDEVERVSELLQAKYGRHSPASTRAMLMPETLGTTLRLASR
jgi:hypothetical protein